MGISLNLQAVVDVEAVVVIPTKQFKNNQGKWVIHKKK